MQPEITAFQICVLTRRAVHLWGESGIGKTAVTQALADVMGERYWPVIMSIREPSDQGGLPVIQHDDDLGTSVWMAPPRWAKELSRAGKGIVHLDELNVAPPVVQNSGLRIVNEGWAGDEKLPRETSFIACGNPPETNTGVYPLTAAMANRFIHIEFPLNVEEFCSGITAGWPTPEVISLDPDWERHVPRMRALVAEFISLRGKEMLHSKPDDVMDASRAWRSPRMWDTAAHMMAAAVGAGQTLDTEEATRKHEDSGQKEQFTQLRSRVVRLLVEGCVGREGAKEFFEWLVKQDLRNPEEYLADPINTPLPKRQDQTLVILRAVTAAALSSNYSAVVLRERYRAAWRLLGRLADDNQSDLTLMSARLLAQNLPAGLEKDLPPECSKLLPMLRDAEIQYGGES
jgi:hypothetical protein